LPLLTVIAVDSVACGCKVVGLSETNMTDVKF
jgi:hypothetical protein